MTRIATAPVNWNNADVPDFRAWLPCQRMIDELVEAGFMATEWGPGMPEDPDELREGWTVAGSTLVGGFVDLGSETRRRTTPRCERRCRRAATPRIWAAGLLIAAEAGDGRRRREAGHVDEDRA